MEYLFTNTSGITINWINQVRNRMENAIITQQTATYGDFLSPILAHFQNVPKSLESTSKINMEILEISYWYSVA